MPRTNPLLRPGWEMPYFNLAEKIGRWGGKKLGSLAGTGITTGLAAIPFVGPPAAVAAGSTISKIGQTIGGGIGGFGGKVIDTMTQLPLSAIDTLFPQIRGRKREGWWDPRTVAGPPQVGPPIPTVGEAAQAISATPEEENQPMFQRSRTKYYHQPILK